MSGPFATRTLSIGGLAALCAVVAAVKIHNSTSIDHYDPNDGSGYFWSESALRFRHAAMVSRGDGVPASDTRLQHPEGLDFHRYDTVAMEHVYGRLHRWLFPQVPLHRFLVYAIAIVTSLSVAVCFFAARSVTGSTAAAWAGALLYGLSPASLARSSGTFLREDFALPLLFGSLACLLACARKQRPAVAAAGAALLVAGLCSWHVAQFFWQILVVAFAVLLLVYGRRSMPAATFTLYAAAAFAASVALPVLRTKLFMFSVPLMLSYALLIVIWVLPRRWPAPRVFWTALVLLATFGAGAFVLQRLGGSHSHVFDVLWGKLRYLGSLPADPTKLSFDAKTYWVSAAYQSPGLEQLMLLWTPGVLLAAAGLLFLVRRGWRLQLPVDQALVLVLTVVFGGLFLLFVRLAVFAVFLAALLAAVAWGSDRERRRTPLIVLFAIGVVVELLARYGVVLVRPVAAAQIGAAVGVHVAVGLAVLLAAASWHLAPDRRKAVWVVILVLGAAFELGRHAPLRFQDMRPPQGEIADVLRFLREHTGPDDPVLAPFELSPLIAAYAGRPVLIHSFFEAPQVRDKVRRLYTAFFEDERALYDECRRLGARYVVYQTYLGIGLIPGSVLYNVGFTALPTSSAAFKFHFVPRDLRLFTLVHHNSHYRVYRVGRGEQTEDLRTPYEPLYDLNMFVEGPLPEALTAEHYRAGKKKINAFNAAMRRADALQKARRHAEAVAQRRAALRIAPHVAVAHHGLGSVLEAMGKTREAGDHYRRALQLDPEHVASLEALAIGLATQGFLDEAADHFKRIVEIDAGSAGAHFNLAVTLWKRGNVDETIEHCRAALALRPEHEGARRLLADAVVRKAREAAPSGATPPGATKDE